MRVRKRRGEPLTLRIYDPLQESSSQPHARARRDAFLDFAPPEIISEVTENFVKDFQFDRKSQGSHPVERDIAPHSLDVIQLTRVVHEVRNGQIRHAKIGRAHV